MTAVRQQIIAAIRDRLQVLPAASEVEVMPSGDPMGWPAIHIFDDGQKSINSEVGSSRYELSVRVELYVEQPGGDVAYTALNDLYAEATAALMTDPPFGGLAETVDDDGVEIFVADLASARRLVAVVPFSITFMTRRGDPAQPA